MPAPAPALIVAAVTDTPPTPDASPAPVDPPPTPAPPVVAAASTDAPVPAPTSPTHPPATALAAPTLPPIDLYHEAELLIRRQFSRRAARKKLLALGFSRADADSAIAAAIAPRRARRWARILLLMLRIVVTSSIAAAAVWWQPGTDHSHQALLYRFGLVLGWLWIGLGGLATVRWFLRHHGFLILIVAIVRPVRTIRMIVMETASEDFEELELPLLSIIVGTALVVYAHHVGQGPGNIIYLDPR